MDEMPIRLDDGTASGEASFFLYYVKRIVRKRRLSVRLHTDSGEADQMDGFKGSFIWSASLFLSYM
jgi:hypothetical protein